MSTQEQAAIAVPTLSAIGRPRVRVARWRQLRRSAAFLLGMTLVLIIAADVLFFQRPVGCTIAVFTALIAGAITLRSERYVRSWPGRIIAIGLLGLILALLEHIGPLRITMALLALLSLAVVNMRGFTHDVPAWIARWLELLMRFALQAPIDVVTGQRWRRAHGAGPAPAERVFVKWALPLVLTLVFVALFAAANPIISNWVSAATTSVKQFFANFSDYISFGRAMLWAMVGFSAWALLRGRVRSGRQGVLATLLDPSSSRPQLLSDGLLIRCLALFNIVFAIQMGLDLATLLSQGGNLPEGMTYSEYARRGAYPLVATALLAAAFVLITFPSGRRDIATIPRSAASVWTRRLVYVWIAQNILLTASAVWRLNMYVDAFGLTRLRVAAAIWMLLVALGLAYIIWRIVAEKSNAWLLRANFLTLIVVLYASCFVNFDRLIAWHGLENSQELGGAGPRVDLHYLRHLGIDAIPALELLHQRLEPDDLVGEHAAVIAANLRLELDESLRSWHGWTWRRQQLARQP